MGEEKLKERQMSGMMDNITEYDAGTGTKFQITIGKRAGFGENESNYFYITLPGDTSEDVLRHINNIMHDSIHKARKQSVAVLQNELQILLGLEKRYE